jgi:S-adenosylmethionine decarboxylase
MQVGIEWVIDADGCDAAALRDAETLASILREVIRDLGLHVLGEAHWHTFPHPGGVTGLVMLTESHLACHTYPEFQSATFNLYCCRLRPEWPWRERLAEKLHATRVNVRKISRGESGAQ